MDPNGNGPPQGGQVQIDPNSIQPLGGQQQGQPQGVQIDPNSIKPIGGQPNQPPSDNNGGHPTSGWGSLLGHTIHIDPNDNPLVNGIKRVAAVGAGAGDALMDTIGGTVDLANKVDKHVLGHQVLPNSVTNTLHSRHADLQHDNAENPMLNATGYGAETLTEFMLGDEALKGLSQADKLTAVAKWMKIAEKSPRLMQALKFGATAAKAQTELSPEEAQLIRQYPKLAKLVGLGVDAARAGTVQGAQTTLRTGGDVRQGAKDALGTAVTAGVIGGVTGTAAHVLGTGRRAAQTISRMGQVASEGPTRTAVQSEISDAVHDAFSQETGTLNNNLTDATSTVGMFGEGAPAQQQITAKAKNAAMTGKQALSDQYQQGLDHLTDMAGDSTIPYEGSPLHQAAQTLDAQGTAQAGPLDQALNVGRPGSPKVNRIIDNLLSVGKDAEGEEGATPEKWVDHNGVEHVEEPTTAGAEGEEAVPPEIGMKHLVEYRQKLARLSRDLSPTNPDYRADKGVYQTLLEGVDNSIGKLADGVGGEAGEAAESMEGEEAGQHLNEDGDPPPSAGRQHFDAMNEAYRQGIAPYQNKTVKAILRGNLNDVGKNIMSGQTSLDDIGAVKKALGDQNFQHISTASLQNIVQGFIDKTTGELDYKKFFQSFNKINPDVRSAMFGDQGKALQAALTTANQAAGGLDQIGKQVTELLGNGNIDSILKDPSQAKAIANVVGPDGMKTLGQSILNNKIAEAASTFDSKTGEITKNNFDPDKVLEWWTSMKDNPEVRDAFFSVDKEAGAKYNTLMSDLSQASSVKKLVKYGVLPLTFGGAGTVFGPVGSLVAAMAAGGAESFGSVRKILDDVANHPNTWRALSGAGKLAENVDKTPAAKAVRGVGAAAIYKGLSSTMGGDEKQTPPDPQQYN